MIYIWLREVYMHVREVLYTYANFLYVVCVVVGGEWRGGQSHGSDGGWRVQVSSFVAVWKNGTAGQGAAGRLGVGGQEK